FRNGRVPEKSIFGKAGNVLKLIYGTGNPGKFSMMKEALKELDVELLSLRDLPAVQEEPEETGRTPLENARQKAEFYYSIFKMPVFSCDSGMYIEGLPEEEQPGVHVRNVGGRRLSDAEMTAYYAGIAHRLGGRCMAEYRNAICLILDENRRYEHYGPDISGVRFYLVDKPVQQKEEGFPLDPISVDVDNGKYFTQLEGQQSIFEKSEGIVRFFRNALGI
ncbi:MAG: non-canonical purine NTP pyrophosphatase, partial [Eisenbergiella massiliensis]